MAESWNGSDEFQVPGLKFQRAGEKALSLNWVCWDWISRKGREARKGTDLKLGNTRNTLKEKNLKPRNTGNQKEEHIQSLAAIGRERWGGRKMEAKRSTQSAGKRKT